jgi:plasmid stability protein
MQSLHSRVWLENQVSSITVRNLPEETHRALRMRAAKAGRSTEAEVRAILEDAARPKGRIKLGSLLAEIGLEAGGFDLVTERDQSATEPVSFE